MIILTAYQTTTLLPNPQQDDSEALTATVVQKRAIDGTLYTYIKTKNQRRKLLFNFKLTPQKALELRAFIRAYYASSVTLKDHLDQTWVGHFTNDPFELVSETADWHTIQLEFEGIKQ